MEEIARACMPDMAYEYVASGAADEITIGWNTAAYSRIRLRPRVLADVATVDMSVELPGRTLPHPVLLAPTAYQKSIHPEGEMATARGASEARATFVVSSATTTSIEEIAAVSTAPLWFQLYLQSDRQFTKDMIHRAENAGCEALCLTVDTPVLGARNRQTRSKFQLADGLMTPHISDIGQGMQPIMDPRRTAVTWDGVNWLKSVSPLPLFLKGIMTGDDAGLAVESGAAGILVSNHGGRNLDTVPATIDVLPEVVEAVAGRVPVLVDGGIRRGTDVVKAIARGATAVLVGRPYCYGLAIAGAAGVRRTVDILVDELSMAMKLLGRPRLKDLDASVLWDTIQ